MKILSINTGSSSLKFSLFEMNNEEVRFLIIQSLLLTTDQ